jgi:hypothetical protein
MNSNLTQQDIESIDADRRMVEAANLKTYELYTKATLAIASGSFLGSALSSIPERANFTILLTSWAFMAATLIILLAEMYYSMQQSGKYADALLYYVTTQNAETPTPPDNKTISLCIHASLLTLIVGLLLLLLSIAIPHFSPC